MLLNIASHTRNWIYLGISALAISGLYSILLVALRAPMLTQLIANKELFRIALVVHVDLSVLVWILSMIAALWCLVIDTKQNYWLQYSFCISSLGVFFISIAPACGETNPVLNNYIPMLENWCFIAGIALFACGVVITAILVLISKVDAILYYANFSSAILVLLSCICFVISYFSIYKLQYPLDLHFFYETLFWSGGHVLQFVYVSGVMTAWLMLIENTASKKLEYNALYIAIFLLHILLALPAFFAHYAYAVDSLDFIAFYTSHMKYCGGIAPILLLIVVALDFVAAPKSSPWQNVILYRVKPATNCLISSVILFLIGGLIGVMISGMNVTIPAHYHGSTVGISIAFMGLSYVILGADDMPWSKAACLQPYIYGVGQVVHIVGLAWSGGYGVLRKSPDMVLSMNAKISMGVMGLGGMIAIIGGLMFVCVCVSRIYRYKLLFKA